jgi:H+/gluconate symporter-like permease
MGLLGILLGLGLLIWLAFRGWSILLLAPAAALLAAAAAGEPLLAHWTQTFMGSAAGFLAQFFPLFLLGALFGKLMEDSGSVAAIASLMTERLGPRRAVLAVVLAGALVTYGGVSLFVALFVLAPMAQALFRTAAIPHRLMPAAIALGFLHLHHVGAPRHARDPERDPDAVLRHHAVRRPGPRYHRRRDHAGVRPVVAGPRRSGGAPGR